jgi:hypothetical protein
MIAASKHVNVMLLQLKMSSWDDDDEEVTLTYLHCTQKYLSERKFSSEQMQSSGGRRTNRKLPHAIYLERESAEIF